MPPVLVTPPIAEPVSISDFMVQLGMGSITDSNLASQLTQQLSGHLIVARARCESHMRRVLIQQEWAGEMDRFPRHEPAYVHSSRHPIWIPQPPFISMTSFRYVDFTGTLQDLPVDLTYGLGPSVPAFAYQLQRGSDTTPARVKPADYRFWPPTPHVDGAVQMQFRCGYGCPVTVSMAAGQAVVTGYTFDPQDAGRAFTIPGASIATTVLTVANGVGTLAMNAAAVVTNTSGWLGNPVPPEILQAIKLLAEFYYTQGGSVDMPIPQAVDALLSPYMNRLS